MAHDLWSRESRTSLQARRRFGVDSGESPDVFAVDVHRQGGRVVVAVRGRLDAPNSRLLGHVLFDLVENQGNLAVEVDLHEVSHPGSSALETVATELFSAPGCRGRVRLVDPGAEMSDSVHNQPRTGGLHDPM